MVRPLQMHCQVDTADTDDSVVDDSYLATSLCSSVGLTAPFKNEGVNNASISSSISSLGLARQRIGSDDGFALPPLVSTVKDVSSAMPPRSVVAQQ